MKNKAFVNSLSNVEVKEGPLTCINPKRKNIQFNDFYGRFT